MQLEQILKHSIVSLQSTVLLTVHGELQLEWDIFSVSYSLQMQACNHAHTLLKKRKMKNYGKGFDVHISVIVAFIGNLL